MSEPGAGYRAPGATTARTRAQAKINLLLRILAREANGYHQLETLFCRLELGDDVVVRTNVDGRSLDCAGDVIPADGLGPVERNLAWRAAVAYADATGWPNDWSIEIDKRIPVGGGLGGGSADAGAVLRCLNALAPSPLPRTALIEIATPLGADVPFLSMDVALGLGWGRGERLLALPCLPSRRVTLACFPFGVPTPDAYRWLDDARPSAEPSGGAFDLHQLTTWAGIAAVAHNDFDAVVASRLTDIERVLSEWRGAFARHGDASAFAMLAGSGSTVFAVADREMPPAADSIRLVATHTATRVVGVEVSG